MTDTGAQRCDMSDLPPSMCAHCKGVTDDTATDLSDVTVAVRFTARHHGRCVIDKAHAIEPGDTIARFAAPFDEGYACERCAKAIR